MGIFASIIVGALTAWLLAKPFFVTADSVSSIPARNDLREERERLLRVIRDLDLDLNTGKIESTDHAHMKNSLSIELAKVLKELGEI